MFGLGPEGRRRSGADDSSSSDGRPFLRRHALGLSLTALVVAVLSMGVAPVRTHVERRSEIASAESELAELVALTSANAERIAALDTDDELERVARQNFLLARPGEEIYQVLPPLRDPPAVPRGWPFDKLADRVAAP
jgi:cell division protein FtsB